MPNAAYALALVLLVLALSVWYHYRLLAQTEVPLLYLTSSHDMDKGTEFSSWETSLKSAMSSAG